MDPQSLNKILDAVEKNERAILLTEMSSGRDRIIYFEHNLMGELKDVVDLVFETGQSKLHEINGHWFFLKIYLPEDK